MAFHDFTCAQSGNGRKRGAPSRVEERSTMQNRVLGLVPEEGRDQDWAPGRMRADDAWALELSVLMDTMNARAVAIDLGQQGMQAALTVVSVRFCVLLR